MKILKYLIKPLKIILFLCVISAVIYYRSIIFHPDVSHKIDLADAYVEEKLKITIPEYYYGKIHDVSVDPGLPEAKVSEVILIESSESVVTVDNETDASAADTVNIDDEVIIGKDLTASDAVAMNKTDSTIDKVIDENKVHANKTEEVSELKVVESQSDNPVNNDIIDQFSETLDMINKKVDMLFNMQESKPVVITDRVTEKSTKESGDTVVSTTNHEGVVSDKDSSVVSSDSRFSDADKILHMARQSFWSGNAQKSEKLYLDLVTIEDNDPDLYGELGNVYYSQGKWQKAGAAYYEAAIRLLAMKQDGQVGYLLRVIQGLDADKAEQLRQKMNG